MKHATAPWYVCRVRRIGDEEADRARLIAAAPEMLDALRRLTHPMADDTDVEFALEVIAKASK